MLTDPRLFPSAMIVLSLLASIVYATQGDVRKATYFLAGAVLNITVVY